MEQKAFLPFAFACTVMLLTLSSVAQTDTLPAMKMPEIPYQPSVKKGWVGQFVYEVHFDGKSAGKSSGHDMWYSVKADCVYSGFVELSSEVRGAIRVNQPDKNNATRWESWIPMGSKKSWSNVDVTIRSLEPTGNMVNDAINGSLEKKFTYSSAGSWIQGWQNNTDLQIDHTTGKYTFAVPYVNYNIKGQEMYVNTTFKPAKKDTTIREMNPSHDFRDLIYIQKVDWYIVEGDFKEGQTEIIIRRRIPLLLQQSTATKTGAVVKLSAAKGYMDFYLIMKRVG